MRRRRILTNEDKRLWASVAKTAKPLPGKMIELPHEPAEPVAPAPPAPPTGKTVGRPGKPVPPVMPARTTNAPPPKFATPKPVPHPMLHPLERPVRRKLASGRLPIDARLDLHDMTQSRAHDALFGFLRQAQALGLRHVLVITGRGSIDGTRGILRRIVPLWFASAEFRGLVSSFESAERHHGGDGALYVRLRRVR